MITNLAILAVVSATATFQFGGGDDNSFAEAVQSATGKAVVMLASDDNTWKSMTFKYSGSDEFQRVLKAKSGVRSSDGGALCSEAWPLGMGYQIYHERYRHRISAPQRSEGFNNGRISLRTKANEGFSLTELGSIGLSKPLAWQRFFEKVRIRIAAVGVTEDELLEALAAAIGAKVLSSKDRNLLVIDASQYRSRAAAMWRKILAKPENELEIANANLMLALLPITDNSLISKAFQDPDFAGGWAHSWDPGTLIHSLAWKRPKHYFAAGDGTGLDLFKRVARPDMPVYVFIRDTGCCEVGYRNTISHERVTF